MANEFVIKKGLIVNETHPITGITNDSGLTFNSARIVSEDAIKKYVNFETSGLTNEHGSLDGLGDDDHLQYALLSGRSGDTLNIDTINKYDTSSVTIEGVNIYNNNIDIPNELNVSGISNFYNDINVSGTTYTHNILFNTGLTIPPHQEGLLFYNSQSLSFYVDEPDITLNIGEENWIKCKNNNSSIPNGSVVYISGSTGINPTIGLADANDLNKLKAIGIATHDIGSSEIGYVTTFGRVREINTSGFSDGDELWLSTTPGQITNIRPSDPNCQIFVGFCIRSHASNGSILVEIDRDKKIDELSNVDIQNPQTGDTLIYDNNIWVNSASTNQNNYLTDVTGDGNSTGVTFERQGLSDIIWDASHNHNNLYYGTGETYTKTQVDNKISGFTFDSENQQIIFNSGGTLSGSSNFIYDGTVFSMTGEDPTGVTLYVSDGVVAGGFASLDFSGTTQPVRQTNDHYKMWLNAPTANIDPHCIGLFNGGVSSRYIHGYGGNYDSGMTHVFKLDSNEYGGAEFKLYDGDENLTIDLDTENSSFYNSVHFNSTKIIKTGVTWTNSNGTEVIINSTNHNLIDYEEIVITGSTDENSLPNDTYNISVIDQDSFKVLVLTNTSGSGTLNYTREIREYLTSVASTGDVDMDTSLEIKSLTVNQNYQNGNFNMLTPAVIGSGDAGGFDHYWVGGTISTGDIIRSISHIGYSGLTGTFSVGDYITGGTSNATAEIARVDGFQVEVLLVDDVSGTFVTGETITGDNGATGLVQEFNAHTPATFEMISSISTFVGSGYVKNVVGTITPGDCVIKVNDNDFFQINGYETGKTFIDTQFENKRIIFGPEEPTIDSDQDSHIFSTLEDDDVRGNFSSQGQNAWLKISITGGDSFLRLSRNGRNSNIANENQSGPDGIIKMDSTSIQTIYTNEDKIEFNYENNDLDFIIYKDIVDEAYRYDAGLDTHNYYSPLNINEKLNFAGFVNSASTSDGDLWYNGSILYFRSGTTNINLLQDLTGNTYWELSGTTINPENNYSVGILNSTNSTSKTTGALTVTGGVGISGSLFTNEVTSTGDITVIREGTSDAEIKFITSSKEYKVENEYATGKWRWYNVTDNYDWINFTLSGISINPDNVDLDFKIFKNTSNTALTYDAGNDELNILTQTIFGNKDSGGVGDIDIISNTNGGNGTLKLYTFSSAGGVHGENHYNRAGGSYNSPTTIPGYASMWFSEYNGYVTGSGYLTGVETRVSASNVWSSSSTPARYEIWTCPINDTTTYERLTIGSDSLIFNNGNQDYDITIENITGDTVFQYDAGNDDFTFSSNLIISGSTFRLTENRTITNSGDTGLKGEIAWDEDYLYICVADNTWKRTTLASW